jgi:hypothetical protein
MKQILIGSFLGVVCPVILAASVLASQNGMAILTGTVSDDQAIVSSATVQAKNIPTGVVYEAISGSRGEYTISGIPAGNYEIYVPPLGFRTDAYLQKDVTIDATQTRRFDIHLVLGNLGVVGDDLAFLAVRDKYKGLSGLAPRTPEGKPDFSGMWQANVDPHPETPLALPWVEEVMKRRQANNFVELPTALCLPADAYPSMPILYKIVQTRGLLLQLFEAFDPHYRQVFLDGRPHPKDPDPTWMGHSIGRWDGDTLIIDSIGFNDKSWLGLDSFPHTEILHVIERYGRPDLAHLTIDVTIEDPGAFSKPFQRHMTWNLAPGEELLEFICNENNKNPENIGKK